MEFDLNLKEQNLICKAILKRKSDGNSILKVKGYAKTVGARIGKINIIISNHIDKVYARLNKIFDEIKGASKRIKN